MKNRPVVAGKVLNLIPLLRYENTAHEAHIYIRPLGELNRSFTLLDDLDRTRVDRLDAEGFTPSALVETSPGNFQAWLKHSQPLDGRLATLAARILADRFDADPSAAGWMRYGRCPGFIRKSVYKKKDGNYPFVLVHSSHSEPFPLAAMFHMEITKHLQLLDEQQTQARQEMRQRLSHASSREVAKRPLSHYRNLAKYHDDPKSADIAFCLFNLALGISEAELAADLESHYLSRNPGVRRRQAYIERTLRKAAAYVAGEAFAKSGYCGSDIFRTLASSGERRYALLACLPLSACPLNDASDEDARFLTFAHQRCPRRGQFVCSLRGSFPRFGHHRNVSVCLRKSSAASLPDRNVQTECSHEMESRCAFNAESPKTIAAVRTRALTPNFLNSSPKKTSLGPLPQTSPFASGGDGARHPSGQCEPHTRSISTKEHDYVSERCQADRQSRPRR